MTSPAQRRIAALERAPRFKDVKEMSLGELLDKMVMLVGEHDPEQAQRLRELPPHDVLRWARDMLAKLENAG